MTIYPGNTNARKHMGKIIKLAWPRIAGNIITYVSMAF